jgi:hypothetical protein
LKQIVNQLRGDAVNQEEWDKIVGAMPVLIERFHENGELFEADFEEFGIRNDKHQAIKGKARDERVIHQRRALLLTHAKVRAKVNGVIPAVAPPAEVVVDDDATTAPPRKKRKYVRTVKVIV